MSLRTFRAIRIFTILLALFVFATNAKASVSWQRICESGFPTVREVAVDPQNNKTVYVGTNNGAYKTINEGGSWSSINYGLTDTEITAIAVDSENTQIVYYGTNSGNIFKSTDGGWSFASVFKTTFERITSLNFDPYDSHIIYAGTQYDGVVKSWDGGITWSKINNGITYNYVMALAVDFIDHQTVYAATWGGGIFKSIDGGFNWFSVNEGLSSNAVVSVAIDPVNNQTVYAATYGGVFKSLDGGISWNAINNGVTTTATAYIVVSPIDNQIVYVGTTNGVFRTVNGGMSWSAVNGGLYNLGISALVLNTRTQVLYLGNNAGIYMGVDSDTDDIDNDGVLNTEDNCISVANADQNNYDGDSDGDACDLDDDNDSVIDADDEFPLNPAEWGDSDGDGVGDNSDVCSLDPSDDSDSDGICGNVDNCQTVSNPTQSDADGDGFGDACDNITPPGGLFVPVSDLDGNYSVAWGKSKTPGVSYVLQEATDKLFTTGVRDAYEGSGLTATITSRVAGDTYYYRVKAVRTGFADSTWKMSKTGCFIGTVVKPANGGGRK